MVAAAPNTTPVYFDCDTGVDDSLALAYLLRTDDVSIVGIGTVSGNVAAADAATNTLRLLALAGETNVPVAVGAHHPLTGSFGGGVPHVHGGNGIGNVDLPPSAREPISTTAAGLLIELSKEFAGSLDIIAVGPLTNLALALREDPLLVDRVRSVTVMGGAARVPGNISAVAEANIGADPEAAEQVINAGWDVTLVPLDVTLEDKFLEGDRQSLLHSGDPFISALGRILDFYFDFHVPIYGHRASALHDALAAAIATGGIEATNCPAVPITVDTSNGPGRGQTICDLRGQRFGPLDEPGSRTRVVLSTSGPFAPRLLRRLGVGTYTS
ncbi:nucleoside hydrolase [Agromyces subbeticus]|uniref:nucleoside hydrolase n=1 Tax=Agromyces subbeticus TaxID=293890 RepID=UPI0003B3B3AC|nr:nucleoside hydrolase [Agromyces subbeticus]